MRPQFFVTIRRATIGITLIGLPFRVSEDGMVAERKPVKRNGVTRKVVKGGAGTSRVESPTARLAGKNETERVACEFVIRESGPIQYYVRRTKELEELTALDVPRGMDPYDLVVRPPSS